MIFIATIPNNRIFSLLNHDLFIYILGKNSDENWGFIYTLEKWVI